MRTCILSTESNQFFEILIAGFYGAGGSAVSTLALLPDRSTVGFPRFSEPWVAWSLFGLKRLPAYLRYRLNPQSVWKLPCLADSADWREKSAKSIAEETVRLESLKQAALADFLEKGAYDVVVSIGAPIIFGPGVLEKAGKEAVNIHNGDIAKYRGHFSTFWELYNSEPEPAVSLHRMALKVDAGDLLGREAVPADGATNLFDALLRKKLLGGKLLAEFLSTMDEAGSPIALTADLEAGASYYGFPTLSDVREFSKRRRASLVW